MGGDHENNKKKKLRLCVCVYSCVFYEHELACWYWEMFSKRDFLYSQSAPIALVFKAKNLEMIALIHVAHKPVKAPVA